MDDDRWSARGTVLVVPAERDGEVHRLDRFWAPPPLDAARVRLYGPDSFCLVVAHELGLVEPADDVVRAAPQRLLLRRVAITAEARSFVLDGTVVSAAIDEGAGDVTAASELAAAVAAATTLPRTCVLDSGERA